jgi:diguanylate cyclase (GGDEF)-like protein/PAS domain S-box-containing protein
LLTLGYPVGDLVVLFAIATIGLRPPAWLHPRATAALVVGLALMFVADVTWGELELIGAGFEPWVDVLYLASTLAIGFAGYVQTGSSRARTDLELSGGLSRWLLLLPYAGLAAGFGVLLATASGEPGGEMIDLVEGAIGLTILVVFRQEFISRENARLLADHARRTTEARFRSLEHQGSEALMLVGIDGVVTYASSSLERVLDVDSRVLIGSPLTRVAHADDVERVSALVSAAAAGQPTAALEWRLWTRSGTWRHVETIPANLLDDPSVGKLVLTTRDVRERKALRQQAAQATLQDLVTGLPNRMLFRDRLAQAIRASQRDGGSTAILLLDIDGFKRVNGTFGTAVGDRLLQEAAHRLAATLGSTDTIARLGGDEFAVLIENTASLDLPRHTADLVRAALLEGAPIDGTVFPMTAAIGIAASDGSAGVDASALMRNADIAMNVAKEQGPDHVVVFEPSMQRELESRFHLENDLRHALERDEFVLQYQPIVDLASGELVAAEALIRWDHPTLGRLGPNVFIPIAEETGLISPIGSWVLRTACAEVAIWAKIAPGRVPRVSVNLSAPQIADPQLAWAVQSALAEASASPGWLTLEVTESMLVHDALGAIERLHAIRALGVQVSVDDFGTGYSSLSYLQQFPINHIKIDRSFVAPLDEPGSGHGLAGAIVEIARALGMTTVAEGIETETQLKQLRAMGGTFGQGFLFAKPLDASAIRLIVKAEQTIRIA